MTDPADRENARTPAWRRVPWWLWVAFAVVIVVGVVLAVVARGQAVDEVSMPAAEAFLVVYSGA